MHPVLAAQHRISQLQQRIRPPGKAPVQLPAESRQQARRPLIPGRLVIAVIDTTTTGTILEHTATASHIEFLRNEPDDDDAVAVCYHGDTPD